jgi:hypothetical protein
MNECRGNSEGQLDGQSEGLTAWLSFSVSPEIET